MLAFLPALTLLRILIQLIMLCPLVYLVVCHDSSLEGRFYMLVTMSFYFYFQQGDCQFGLVSQFLKFLNQGIQTRKQHDFSSPIMSYHL